MPTLLDDLLQSADVHSERPAVRLDHITVSYRQLVAAATQVEALLIERGVRSGDRVGLSMPNVPAFPAAFFGALAAGAVVVPMNPALKRREVEHYVRDSRIVIVLASAAPDDWDRHVHDTAYPNHADAFDGVAPVQHLDPDPRRWQLADQKPVVPVDRDEAATAVILYTSGTTGTPKGARLSHRNLRSNAWTTAVTLIEAGPADVVLGCLPLFHVFGLTCGLNASVTAGACLTLVARFDATKVLAVIERDHVTIVEGVPTMYRALLQQRHVTTTDVRTVRTCLTGGAATSAALVDAIAAGFRCLALEGYGLSEAGGVVCFNKPHGKVRVGTVGTAVRGMQVQVLDDNGVEVSEGEVGEIAINGEGLMSGYWDRPQETAQVMRNGWFLTGDLGSRDKDGFITIVDRKKDLIIRGGYNVYPREVEEVLSEHSDVAEAAVIGIPDPALGEEVGAAVVRTAAGTASPEELREYVRARIASYKYPRVVWLVDDLPKGPSGKILRRLVIAPDVRPI